jgi:hypothetical protein
VSIGSKLRTDGITTAASGGSEHEIGDGGVTLPVDHNWLDSERERVGRPGLESAWSSRVRIMAGFKDDRNLSGSGTARAYANVTTSKTCTKPHTKMSLGQCASQDRGVKQSRKSAVSAESEYN